MGARPSRKWDLRFLALAEHVAQWSKDPSTKVGAVVVDRDNRVVSLGYNGFPRGVRDTQKRLKNRAVKYRIILHGDLNAMLFARRSLEGCTLYVWPFLTCTPCGSTAIQVGIKRVVAPGPTFPGLPPSVKEATERWGDDFKLVRELYAEAGVTVTLL